MPWFDVIWTDKAQQKIAAHDVCPGEVEYVLAHGRHTVSRSSGQPLMMGETKARRSLVVVYEQVDRVTVVPITAYEPD